MFLPHCRNKYKDPSTQKSPTEMSMKRPTLTVCVLVVLAALNAQSQVPQPLKLLQAIPLAGLKDGDFDHFQVDLPGQRLFLAADDNSAIVAVTGRFFWTSILMSASSAAVACWISSTPASMAHFRPSPP